MEGTDTEEGQLLVKLFTKHKKYQVPESEFSLPSNATCEQLQQLINGLLAGQDERESEGPTFDFLVKGQFLRTSLSDYVDKEQLSTESVLEVEYIVQESAPQLEHSLQHDDWVSCIDQHTDGWIVTGSYDNTLSIWDSQGKCVLTMEGHQMPVKSVRWLRDEEDGQISLISSSHDESALMWKFNAEQLTCTCVYICKGHSASVDCIAVEGNSLPQGTPLGNEGRFATGSWDKLIKIWDAGFTGCVSDEATPEDTGSKRNKSSGEKNVASTRTPLLTLSGHKEPVSCIQWTDSSVMYSAGWDHAIRTWDVQTGTNTSTLTGSKSILSLSYSEHSQLIATGSADKNVRLWDPRSKDGSIVRTSLSSHNGWISSVEWSPTHEHQLVSGSYDNKVKLWDVRSSTECLHELTKHSDKVLCVCWKEAQSILSGGADNTVNVNRASNI